MDTLDDLENDSVQFTTDHLLKIYAQHAEPDAMLYAGAMAATICEFIEKRYGAAAAHSLMSGLARMAGKSH